MKRKINLYLLFAALVLATSVAFAQVPVANFHSSDTVSCSQSGICIDFFDLSTGSPTSWQWSFPGAVPDTSTLQNPINICYFNPGTYPVSLIVSNVSGGDTLMVSPMITLASSPPPPVISVNGGDTLCSTPSASYQWYYNGSPIAGATDQCYIPTQGGTYAVLITDSFGCQSISSGVFSNALQVHGNSTSICIGDSVRLNFTVTGGQSPYNYSYSPNVSSNLWVSPQVTTVYYLTVIDGASSTASDSLTVTVVQQCNHVNGYCYYDLNNNGTIDNGEPGFRNALVTSVGGSYTVSSRPDAQGAFSNLTSTGTITTSLNNVAMLPYYTYSPAQHISNFSSFGNIDSVNFAFTPIPGIQDLNITLYPWSRSRPGFNTLYYIYYENVGTDTMSGIIELIKDSRLTMISSIPNYSSVAGDTIVWNYSNLAPGQNGYISVTLNVSSSVTIGSVLVSNAIIEPVATDTTPSDNTSNLEDFVSGSMDPNDKIMLTGDVITTAQVANGEYLTYLIRFQNTGNDTAFTIVVRDTLDNKVDFSTFQMVSSSHTYNLIIENQKYVKWTFNNILLPDSGHNEPASHGYVCYRIKARNTVANGDIIRNTGYIYFDFNTAVATNTTTTNVILINSICDCWFMPNLVLYPNPAKGSVTVHYQLLKAASVKMEIYSLLSLQAQLLNENQNAGTYDFAFDSKQLANGIYFVKITVDGNTGVMKMVKME